MLEVAWCPDRSRNWRAVTRRPTRYCGVPWISIVVADGANGESWAEDGWLTDLLRRRTLVLGVYHVPTSL